MSKEVYVLSVTNIRHQLWASRKHLSEHWFIFTYDIVGSITRWRAGCAARAAAWARAPRRCRRSARA